MNTRDFSALIFIFVFATIIVGYKFNTKYMDDYSHQYNAYHRTIPIKSDSNSTLYTSESFEPSETVKGMLKQKPPIPAAYKNLLDITDYLDEEKKLDFIPFYWHLHRSAGGSFVHLMGQCLDLTLASSSYPKLEFDNDDLQLVRSDGIKYINVNLLTREGIGRANRMEIGMANKEKGALGADAIISPQVHDIGSLLFAKKDRYSTISKGGMFTIIRSPIQREISLFYTMRNMNHTSGEDISSYELIDWIRSPVYMGNMMIRQLSNKVDPAVDITIKDLYLAKEILRRKAIIGLLDKKVESWSRFKKIFGPQWSLDGQVQLADEHCEEKLLNWGWKNKNPESTIIDFTVVNSMQKHDPNIVDLETFNKLASLNQFDMMLFEYAHFLFWEQRVLFESVK